VPKQKGQKSKQISYRITQDLEKKIDEIIIENNYPSRAKFMEVAIREFVLKKEFEKNLDSRIKSFINSEEGRELIRKIIDESD
jgi:metal-responsive CopG/Arc/MetJ family transcriptional regulator